MSTAENPNESLDASIAELGSLNELARNLGEQIEQTQRRDYAQAFHDRFIRTMLTLAAARSQGIAISPNKSDLGVSNAQSEIAEALVRTLGLSRDFGQYIHDSLPRAFRAAVKSVRLAQDYVETMTSNEKSLGEIRIVADLHHPSVDNPVEPLLKLKEALEKGADKPSYKAKSAVQDLAQLAVEAPRFESANGQQYEHDAISQSMMSFAEHCEID